MRRTRTWIVAGVGLAVVLATGWLVLAQAPNPLPDKTILPSPAVQPPTPVPSVGVPVPVPPTNWQVQQAQAVNLQPPPPALNPSPPPPAPPPPPKINGDLIQELIQIINETRSVDTFFVTTKLLEEMGAKSRVAVPAIIRNAERLELFKDAFLQTEKDAEKKKRSEVAELIVDSLAKIMSISQGGTTARPPVSTTPAPLTPPATKRDPADPLLTPSSGRLNVPPSVNGMSLR